MSPAPELARLIDPTRPHHTGSSPKVDLYAFNRLAILERKYTETLHRSFEEGKDNLLFYCRIRGRRKDDDAELQKIVSLAQEAVLRACGEDVGGSILSAEHIWGDDYVGLLGLKREVKGPTIDPQRLNLLRLNSRLREGLLSAGINVDASVAFVPIRLDPKYASIQLVDAVREARDAADALDELKGAILPDEFDDLTLRSGLTSVYQPLISFRSGSVIGWEACVRGPERSHFPSPLDLFSFAEEAGLLTQLETACWKAALRCSGDLEPDQKLFLNLHPRTIMEGTFLGSSADKILAQASLKPQKVVIEITERHAVPDFASFNTFVRDARRRGFLIAIDDVGSGYAGLQTIAEIKPDFIKLDYGLVRGLNKDRTRSALLEALIGFADKVGCTVIAEGIESESDLEVLINLGTHCGQGYLLGIPALPKPIPSEEVLSKILFSFTKARQRLWSFPFLIGDIVEEVPTVAKEEKVCTVKEFLDKNPSVPGVVVMDGPRTCGLVMRHQLNAVLATLYGIPLNYDKPISRLTDTSPLTFEADTPTETVFQAAMDRGKDNLYDHIIVTHDEQLKGIVSMQALFDLMHQFRIELARSANPLSGLPGNNAIERQLMNRIRAQRPFSVILIDLDHFKSFNDKYGFDRGDKVLLLTSRILAAVLRKYGSESDFLGHIGGDDFFIVTETHCAEELCSRVTKYFDRLIRSHYDEDDRGAGKIFGHDRDGNQRWFPLVAISMAYLDVSPDNAKYVDLRQVLEKLTQLKQYAKSIPGSIFVQDRRKD